MINRILHSWSFHMKFMKLTKGSFHKLHMKLETNYLRFLINDSGIRPDPLKVEAIKSLPAPTRVRVVGCFIGMTSHYCRFIPNFYKIAEPAIALTHNTHKIQMVQHSSIQKRVWQLCLSFHIQIRFNRPHCTHMPVICVSVRVWLSHGTRKMVFCQMLKMRLIYYLSYKLSKRQCKWSMIKKLLRSIIHQKLDYYLNNSRFVTKTDHKLLKYVLESPIQNLSCF